MTATEVAIFLLKIAENEVGYCIFLNFLLIYHGCPFCSMSSHPCVHLIKKIISTFYISICYLKFYFNITMPTHQTMIEIKALIPYIGYL